MLNQKIEFLPLNHPILIGFGTILFTIHFGGLTPIFGNIQIPTKNSFFFLSPWSFAHRVFFLYQKIEISCKQIEMLVEKQLMLFFSRFFFKIETRHFLPGVVWVFHVQQKYSHVAAANLRVMQFFNHSLSLSSSLILPKIWAYFLELWFDGLLKVVGKIQNIPQMVIYHGRK